MRPSAQLYQPLQTALDKSMVRRQRAQLANEIPLGSTSRISRRMRSLSPEQANYIRRSTILPVDKVLVPTDHLWKVRGKQFSAVNIQVREGQPIPASMMRIPVGERPQMITTQTVYEAVPRKTEVRSLNNTRSITNLRTVYPPPQQSFMPVRISTPAVIQRPASPIRIIQRPSTFNPTSQYQIKKIQPINTMSRTKVTSRNSNQMYMNSQQQKVQSTPTEYYDNGWQQSRVTSQTSKKSKYKYNFFSALDEAVNTQCGSCGSNEIIASKPLTSWE